MLRTQTLKAQLIAEILEDPTSNQHSCNLHKIIKILCVVGSAKFYTTDGANTALREVQRAIKRHRPHIIISGGAPYVDTYAEQEAGYQNIPFIKYPPEYNAWPAYKKRNLLMAQRCTHLVRIVSSRSTTYGSGWTRDRARELGKPCEEIIVKE